MIARNIDYGWDGAALFIIGTLFWLGFYIYLSSFRKRALQSLAVEPLIENIARPRSPLLSWMRVSFLLLAWIFACLALMQPRTYVRYAGEDLSAVPGTERPPPQTVLFLIDASASMGVNDTRLKQSRLENAKEIAEMILDQMGGDNIGVYAFTSSLSKLSPPTLDHLFARMVLKNIEINEGESSGTDFKTALSGLHETYFSKPSDMRYTVILLSDGEDTVLEGLQGSAKEQAIRELFELAAPPAGTSFRLFTIALGSPEGGTVPKVAYNGQPVISHANFGLLEQLSKSGNGKVYKANDITPVALAKDISVQMTTPGAYVKAVKPTAEEIKESSIYRLYFQIPLGIALFFLGLAIAWPQIWFERRSVNG